MSDCVKDAYNKIKRQKGKTSLEKLLAAYEDADEKLPGDSILHKPIKDWTDQELQWAVDNIYRESHDNYYERNV